MSGGWCWVVDGGGLGCEELGRGWGDRGLGCGECLLDRHQGGVCMIWVMSSKGYVQCYKFVNST